MESIIAGSAFAVLFGVLMITRGGEWWWLFPIFFAGVLPIAEGIRRLFTRKKETAKSTVEKETQAEREILQAAKDRGGRLTATVASLHTRLSIQQAQVVLERLTMEGHAVMNVTNDGIIEFQFPEFLPPMGSTLGSDVRHLPK